MFIHVDTRRDIDFDTWLSELVFPPILLDEVQEELDNDNGGVMYFWDIISPDNERQKAHELLLNYPDTVGIWSKHWAFNTEHGRASIQSFVNRVTEGDING